MTRILVIHGPNLNLLGQREPEVYGSLTLEEINRQLEQKAQELGVELTLRQSNHEGEIVEAIQQARDRFGAILINPAAYTHQSL
ncbi:MAG: type II 3-dehydroquinate dehydratase, partial [Firmicutes bacterium]|nr:type II 3-dehydroquinate dehydratase [Bacillota bacterium]